jgi:tetratricopeptide (TPR) repeat protein
MKTLIPFVSVVMCLMSGIPGIVVAEDVDELAAGESRGGVTEFLSEIEARDKTIAEKDKAIAELKAAFEEISTAFRKKVSEMEPSDAVALETQRDDALKARDEALAQRDEAFKVRDEAALSSSAKIRELEELLAEKQDSLGKLQQAIGVKDAEIARLETELSSAQDATRKEKLTLAYNIGCIYKAGRQYARAEQEFLKALALAPDDPGVHYNLGILYDDNLGDANKARHHYKRFLDLAPTDKDAPNVVEWLSALQ